MSAEGVGQMHHRGVSRPAPPSLPIELSWVLRLDAPVWVCTFDGSVTYLNRQARRLFGRDSSEEICDPCHCLVAGLDLAGEPFCCPDCYFRKCIRKGIPIAPRTLLVQPPRGAKRFVQVIPLTIPIATSSSPILVHLAAEAAVNLRAEKYLRNVARRSGNVESAATEFVSLTEREKQVLLRLIEDDSLTAVASALNISYHTVRNHVQHVIRKLGAHSVEEAIARFLTGER